MVLLGVSLCNGLMTGNLVLNFGKMSFLKRAENGRKWTKMASIGEKRDGREERAERGG